MAESPAAIVVNQRVEWSDTDASGFHHNTFVIRLLEAAEAALHRRLGLGTTLFGRIPRVRTDLSYRRRLSFGDLVEARLRVSSIGRSSLTYAFEILRDGDVVADGEVVIVHVGPQGDRSEEWPTEVRRAFATGGSHTASPVTVDQS